MRYAQEIATAINEKRLLTFRYDRVIRSVEPHIIGYDRQGHLALSAWQLSGTGQGWRLFHVSNSSALSITDQTFAGPRRGYNPRDAGFVRVLARL